MAEGGPSSSSYADEFKMEAETTGNCILLGPTTLQSPKYKPFSKIIRIVHFDKFENEYRKKKFEECTGRGGYMGRSKLPSQDKFAIFRPITQEDLEKGSHTPLGNVAYSLNLLEILKEDSEIKLYLVDSACYIGYIISHVLVSKESNFENYKELKLDDLKWGDPIFMIKGELQYVYKTQKGPKYSKTRHSVELVFDLKSISSKWLFNSSEISPANHSNANTKDKDYNYLKGRCIRYNQSNMTCPYPWSIFNCSKRIADSQQWISRHISILESHSLPQ